MIDRETERGVGIGEVVGEGAGVGLKLEVEVSSLAYSMTQSLLF